MESLYQIKNKNGKYGEKICTKLTETTEHFKLKYRLLRCVISTRMERSCALHPTCMLHASAVCMKYICLKDYLINKFKQYY